MPELSTSVTVAAQPDAVWAFLRDFNGVGDWHPAMPSSVIEEGCEPDEVGAVRRYAMPDGTLLRERLTAFSDDDRRYSYAIVETTLPLREGSGTIAVDTAPPGGGATITWSVSFLCPPEAERHLEDFMRNVVFGTGMVVLGARFQ
ncbi:SRPBCC family protein [Sinosporangium siamense]|uniref:Polyketide cyclase n=1 Tax=Sinosporangium siamense TaxID=1367973 RepID=A0A919RHY6_9ACTN|nr:SRPBCC family protein [Sinosporangium siamense]GII92306.1 polyketide cyclase [Sinosporangium siamense]